MRRGVAVWVVCAFGLGWATLASARGERELSEEELRAEMAHNHALAAYVARNGDPDLAESHFLADAPPWDDHEVTVYYLEARKELGFARAYILGRPTVEMQRYERPLTDEQIAALTTRLHGRVKSGEATAGLGPDERAELSARRAEDAAGRVEAAAESAEHAADRAEAIAAHSERSFHEGLRK
jgi:hypothetical protein